MLAAGLDVGVRHTEVATPAYAKELGGFGGFFGANFGGATRAHFAGGEIENARFVASVGHFQECAAAGEFHVVGVGGYGEQVEVHRSLPYILF